MALCLEEPGAHQHPDLLGGGPLGSDLAGRAKLISRLWSVENVVPLMDAREITPGEARHLQTSRRQGRDLKLTHDQVVSPVDTVLTGRVDDGTP